MGMELHGGRRDRQMLNPGWLENELWKHEICNFREMEFPRIGPLSTSYDDGADDDEDETAESVSVSSWPWEVGSTNNNN